jgi:hypothetical protein
MLVGADDGAIEEMHVPIKLPSGIRLLLQGVKQPLKDPGVPPPVKAAGHRAPGAVALRQVVLGSASTKNPQHAVKDAAMVDGWSTRLGFLWGKQRLEPLLLRVVRSPWCIVLAMIGSAFEFANTP